MTESTAPDRHVVGLPQSEALPPWCSHVWLIDDRGDYTLRLEALAVVELSVPGKTFPKNDSQAIADKIESAIREAAENMALHFVAGANIMAEIADVPGPVAS